MADSTLSFSILAKDNASSTITKVGQKFGALHLSVGKVARGVAAVGPALAGLAVGAGIKQFIDDARESARVGRLTEQVVKSTGGAAKITAEQVGDLATAISNKTGADDEAIQSGQNLLLTFTNIRNGVGKGNDIFNQASQAITDMTAALNDGQVTAEGMHSSSIQLGKALNDPIKGVTALQKVGVSFTADQKKQIKTLVESGKTMQAQKIILGELSKEFGGAAEAAADPVTKLKTIVGNASESIGGALLPIVNKGATALGKVIPKAIGLATIGVQAMGAAFQGEGVTSAGFVGVMERIGVTARKVFDGFKTYVLPRLKDFGGFLTGTIIPAVVRFGGFVKDKVATVVIPVVKDLVATFGPLVTEVGGKLVDAVKDLTPKIIGLGKSIADKVGPAVLAVTGFFREHKTAVRAVAVGIGAAVLAFKGFQVVTGIISGVKTAIVAAKGAVLALNLAMKANVIGLVIAALVGLAVGLKYAYDHSAKFRKIVDSLGGALKTAFLAVVDFGKGVVKWFKDLPGNITKGLGDFAKLLVRKGQDLINGLIGGIWSIAKGIDKWMMRAPVAKLLAPWYGAAKWLIPHGVKLLQGFLGGVLNVAKTVGSWLLRNVISPVVGAFARAGQWLVQRGRDVIGGLIAGVTAYIRGIKGIGTWIYNKVIVPAVTPFAKANTWLLQKGRDLIGGMLGGIGSAMKNIGSWIKANVVDPVINAVKKFFGINSPSKVFAEIGGHLIGGLFKGLTSSNPGAFVTKIFGGMPDALRAIVGKGIIAIQSLPQKALEALGAVDKAIGSVPLATGMAKLVQGIAASFGWGSGNQWNALYKLIMGESGFRPNAQNPTSSAYGLFQFLDSTWGTVGGHKTSDPTLQTIYGLKYIQSVYGSPANAYAQWSARSPHWYERGTPWVPNDQLAQLHEGEAVIPRKVNEARLRGGGGQAVDLTLRVAPGGDSALAQVVHKLVRTGVIQLSVGGKPVRVAGS